VRRVLGVNSFGTVSDNSTDLAFYFAISMRELAAFLRQAKVEAHVSGLPCTSIADLDRAESERAASDQARQAADAEARRHQGESAGKSASRCGNRGSFGTRQRHGAGGLLLVAALLAGGSACCSRSATRHATSGSRAAPGACCCWPRS
jgi:hypothetical protein